MFKYARPRADGGAALFAARVVVPVGGGDETVVGSARAYAEYKFPEI